MATPKTPSYERDLATLGDETKQKTLSGWGYKFEYSDKTNGIGGWVPVTDSAKAKFKTIYGEDYKGNKATLKLGNKSVVAFGQKAYTGGLFSQGYSLQNSIINENQQTDFNNKEVANIPPTNMPAIVSPEDFMKPYKDILDKYMGDMEKPDLPNMVDVFKDELTKYGIPELEQSIADLTQQKQAEEALQRERRKSEEGKTVALGVIGGRTSEIDRQSYEKQDFIGRQLDYATNQLNNKYSMVNTIMNLTQTDYTNATNAYNTQFSQAMDMINFTKGVMKDYRDEQWRSYTEEQRIAERAQDTARANLTVVYNNITSGTTDYGSLDEATKASITKMEMESGFPVGFVKNLYSNNPKQDIISTTSRQEANGDSYSDVIMRDQKTGAISVQHIFLGKSKVTGSGGSGSTATYGKEKDASGGLSFTDKKGNAITAGEYAVANKENLISLLKESGNPDDANNVIDIQLMVDDVASGDQKIADVCKILRDEYSHIFGKLQDSQIIAILGLKQGTKKKDSGGF